MLAHLDQLGVGIAFLQEIHLCRADVMRIQRSWVGKVFHSKFNSKARGTAILVHKGVTFESDKIIADPDGRFIIVTGQLLSKPVILASVYVPNWDDLLY